MEASRPTVDPIAALLAEQLRGPHDPVPALLAHSIRLALAGHCWPPSRFAPSIPHS